jgi:colicin import membrane protein
VARNTHVPHGLLGSLVSGAKDIPRNASWLAGKALPHEGATNGTGGDRSSSRSPSNGSGRSLVQRAGDAVREVMPGQDSVEHRLTQARDGAERAQEAEDRAVEAAERAHELSERVDVVESEESQRLQEVRRQLSDEVDRKVRSAEREAADLVARARQEAEAEAERELEQQEQVSAERQEAARAEAERAQQEAHERFTEATERLARARGLAEEAAALAQEAAEKARQDAERISAAAQSAQSGRKQADRAVSQAHRLRERTEKEAATVTQKVQRTTKGGALSTMSRADLLHLAQERDIPGRSSMSKKQLLSALGKKR